MIQFPKATADAIEACFAMCGSIASEMVNQSRPQVIVLGHIAPVRSQRGQGIRVPFVRAKEKATLIRRNPPTTTTCNSGSGDDALSASFPDRTSLGSSLDAVRDSERIFELLDLS